MTKLVSLDEFNKNRIVIPNNTPNRLNGIVCPKCGNELVDPTPDRMLPSSPPQMNIKCMHCDYSGYRKA